MNWSRLLITAVVVAVMIKAYNKNFFGLKALLS